RAFPNLEPRVGGAHLLSEEFEVALAERRDLAVADHVDIGRGGVEEDILLAVAQAFIRRADTRLGRLDVVQCLKAVEYRLLDLDAEGAGADLDAVLAADAQAAGGAHRGPPPRLRDRDIFVGDTHAGARRVEAGIVL